MMNAGVSSYTYGWSVGVAASMPEKPMDEIELINKAVTFGTPVLQIGDNLPVHLFSKARLAQFKSLLHESGLALELGAKGLTSAHLATYISLCRELDVSLLRFVIDDENYAPSIPDIIGVINLAVPLLKENQVTLALENHDRLRAREYAQIVSSIDDARVGICLDSVNSFGAAEGLETIVSILGPFTVNLHIKDFGIKRLPHKMGFVTDGRIAGQGKLDIPWLLENISSYGRCSSAILEQWVPPDTSIDQTILKEKQWAEAGFHYLRSLNKLNFKGLSAK